MHLSCFIITVKLKCFLAEQTFKNAQNILNAMRANKSEGYELLIEAAQLGHREARSMLAWARLLGSRLGPASLRVSIDDILRIFEIFKELADTGLPSAHMVCTSHEKDNIRNVHK